MLHSYDLMLSCWQFSAERRPRAPELVDFLTCKDEEEGVGEVEVSAGLPVQEAFKPVNFYVPVSCQALYVGLNFMLSSFVHRKLKYDHHSEL